MINLLNKPTSAVTGNEPIRLIGETAQPTMEASESSSWPEPPTFKEGVDMDRIVGALDDLIQGPLAGSESSEHNIRYDRTYTGSPDGQNENLTVQSKRLKPKRI